MKESQVINEWMREGERKGALKIAREFLVEAIQLHFNIAAPEDIRLAIEGANEADTLRRWLRAAVKAESLEQFRASMHPPP